MRHRTITATTIALGFTALAASPAFATETPAPTPVEVYWAMQDGGTPERVTWPQSLADSGSLDCGVYYQVDTYPSDRVAELTADGILTNGEDHGIVTSWRFVYGGDCVVIPEQPADIVTGASSEALDCEGRTYTFSETETRTTHVYDEATNAWIAGEPVTTELGRDTRPATEAECPTPVESTSPEGEAQAVAAAPGARQLAATGPTTGWLIPMGGGLLLSGIAAVASRIRRARV